MCLDVTWVPDSYICLPVWKVIEPLYHRGRATPLYFKTPFIDCFFPWGLNQITAAETEYTFHTEPFIELRGECVHAFLEKPQVVAYDALCVPALAVGVLGYNMKEVGSFQLILDTRRGQIPENVDKPPGFDECLARIKQRHDILRQKFPEKYDVSRSPLCS